MGEEGQTEILLSTLTPTMVRLAWAKPLLIAPPWLTSIVPNPQKGEHQMHRPVCRVICRVPNSVLDVKVGAIWPGNVQPQPLS